MAIGGAEQYQRDLLALQQGAQTLGRFVVAAGSSLAQPDYAFAGSPDWEQTAGRLDDARLIEATRYAADVLSRQLVNRHALHILFTTDVTAMPRITPRKRSFDSAGGVGGGTAEWQLRHIWQQDRLSVLPYKAEDMTEYRLDWCPADDPEVRHIFTVGYKDQTPIYAEAEIEFASDVESLSKIYETFDGHYHLVTQLLAGKFSNEAAMHELLAQIPFTEETQPTHTLLKHRARSIKASQLMPVHDDIRADADQIQEATTVMERIAREAL